MTRYLEEWRLRVVVVASVALLTACAGVDSGQGAAADASEGEFPMTLDNCGKEITLERRPEEVLTIGTPAATMLYLAGAAEKIVARAGEFDNPPDGAAGEAVADVPVVVQDTPNLETIIGTGADLVVSYGLFGTTAEDLAEAGIDSIVLSGYCGNDGASEVGDGQHFEDLYTDIERFGTLFGTGKQATASADDLRARVAAVEEGAPQGPARTAAAFYFLGGEGPYVYGDVSIVTRMMEVFGLTNVFPGAQLQDAPVSVEEFVSADPDVLILLYGYEPDDTFETAKEDLLALPGADDMTAVVDNRIVGIAGPRAEPSPAAVDGLEELAKGFAALE